MISFDKYNLEHNYDELLVAEAENLFRKNAILDVTQPEKNLFVFAIFDGHDLETEIFKPFTKVQKSTCSCAFHQNHGVCKHVIAGLFHLRAQKKSFQTKKSEPIQTKARVLNTHTLLQHVEREELIHFVRDYARKDSRFALQLKIHFAKNVDLPNNREKYEQLLNAIIKPNTGKTRPNQNELKAFIKVIDDLIDQMEDRVALEQYEEAFHMLQAGFYKFCYVHHHHGQDSLSFHKQNKRWIEAIGAFLNEKIPYALKKQIKDFLKDISFLSFYRYHDIEYNAGRTLKEHVGQKEKKEYIKKLSDHAQSLVGEDKVNAFAILADLAEEMTAEVRKVIFETGFPLTIFYQKLSQIKAWTLCRQMVEMSMKIQGSPAELFLFHAENLTFHRDFQVASEVACFYFQRTGQITAFQKLREAAGQEVWQSELKPRIDQRVFNDNRPMAVACYLHWEKNWESLYHFLLLQEDLLPYLRLLTEMASHRPKETEYLISHHLTAYLKHHLGEKSQEDVQLFFRQMDGAKLFVTRKKVAAQLSKIFADRQALVQCLKPYL